MVDESSAGARFARDRAGMNEVPPEAIEMMKASSSRFQRVFNAKMQGEGGAGGDTARSGMRRESRAAGTGGAPSFTHARVIE